MKSDLLFMLILIVQLLGGTALFGLYDENHIIYYLIGGIVLMLLSVGLAIMLSIKLERERNVKEKE